MIKKKQQKRLSVYKIIAGLGELLHPQDLLGAEQAPVVVQEVPEHKAKKVVTNLSHKLIFNNRFLFLPSRLNSLSQNSSRQCGTVRSWLPL